MLHLPERSVLVVDNASYHNTEVDRAPNSSARKADMQTWLRNHHIPFTEDMLKVELYELILRNKDRHIRYVIDEILAEKGHTVIRLPPYHPELNSIELIWAELKNWVASHNTTFNVNDVMKLCEKKFSEIGSAEWQRKCNHTKKVEEDYRTVQGLIENEIESFVINVNSESENSSIDNDLSGFESMEETTQ